MKAEDKAGDILTACGPVMEMMMRVVLKCAREHGRIDLPRVACAASPHMLGETPRKIKQAGHFNCAVRIMSWEAMTMLNRARILKQIEPWANADDPWNRGGGLFQLADGLE